MTLRVITGGRNCNYEYAISDDETLLEIKIHPYSNESGSFDVPLADIRTKIKNAKLPPHRIWQCLHCGKHTDYHSFMVTDMLWGQVIGPRDAGVIHLHCFEDMMEKQLGRKLTIEDFMDCLLNHNIFVGYRLGKFNPVETNPLSAPISGC